MIGSPLHNSSIRSRAQFLPNRRPTLQRSNEYLVTAHCRQRAPRDFHVEYFYQALSSTLVFCSHDRDATTVPALEWRLDSLNTTSTPTPTPCLRCSSVPACMCCPPRPRALLWAPTRPLVPEMLLARPMMPDSSHNYST